MLGEAVAELLRRAEAAGRHGDDLLEEDAPRVLPLRRAAEGPPPQLRAELQLLLPQTLRVVVRVQRREVLLLAALGRVVRPRRAFVVVEACASLVLAVAAVVLVVKAAAAVDRGALDEELGEPHLANLVVRRAAVLTAPQPQGIGDEGLPELVPHAARVPREDALSRRRRKLPLQVCNRAVPVVVAHVPDVCAAEPADGAVEVQRLLQAAALREL